MQARLMFPMLLLFAAAGCARSTEAPGARPGAGEAVPTSPGTAPQSAGTESQPQSPSQSPSQSSSQSSSQSRTAAPAGTVAGAPQGIRVGEPDPHGQPWQRRGGRVQGQAWHAFGNEPFWSVQARGATLVFTTPGDQSGVTLTGRRVPSLVGTVILGSGPKGEFHFGVTPGECSDGMSDRSYDFASTFIYGGTTYKGCAERLDAR